MNQAAGNSAGTIQVVGRPFPRGAAGLASYIKARTDDGWEIADFMMGVMHGDKIEGRAPRTVERKEAARWLADQDWAGRFNSWTLSRLTNIRSTTGGPITPTSNCWPCWMHLRIGSPHWRSTARRGSWTPRRSERSRNYACGMRLVAIGTLANPPQPQRKKPTKGDDSLGGTLH